MFLKRIALLVTCSLAFSCINAQVPIIPEPVQFKFENYSLNPTFKTTQAQPTVQIPSVPTYSTQANTQVPNPSMWMIDKYYVPTNLSPQEQVKYADEQIRLHELEQKQQQQRLVEANSALDEMHIEYEIPFESNPDKNIYALAFNELEKMLSGASPISLERAVFMVEKAFDPTLDFSAFDNQLNKSVSVIGRKMELDKLSPFDNLGKILTTFKFMADTISVLTKGETTITTYPKKYDFEDFWGRQDYRKMFVSKLLKEGSGQCHSLPLLFLLLCEKMNAEAHLAFAPNHSFIKFQDTRGKWHNLELTNGMLASDHFMIESGYIKAEAIQNKIYMEPLTKKQVLVQCLNDLALGYQKKFGFDPFVKECVNVALSHDPKSLTAHQTRANYYINLSNYIVYQYKTKKLSRSLFDHDEQAQAIIKITEKAMQDIDDLGYAEMPPEAYAAWLNSIQKEACKQQHSNEVKILGGMIERK